MTEKLSPDSSNRQKMCMRPCDGSKTKPACDWPDCLVAYATTANPLEGETPRTDANSVAGVQLATDCREQAEASASRQTQWEQEPCAWRYRFSGNKTNTESQWKYVEDKNDMNPGDGYEREPLYKFPWDADGERYRRLRRSYYQQRCMIGPDLKPSEDDFNKAYDAAEDRHYGPSG